jgi:nanoRNase/pAp phosphatase (c-di-AMP/oligoRNAs hydrolase)
MSEDSIKQATELLKKAKNILVCLPRVLSTDAISSGVALHLVLSNLGKNVRVVGSDQEMPESHGFLPKSGEIATNLANLKKFVISVDLRKAPISELSYNTQNDKLNIYLTPKQGFYQHSDISTSTTQPEFDCVITLDCQDLDHMGSLFEQNTEFFYATPIINIDHSPANEHFGQVNIVDLVATSVSEIVVDLIKQVDPGIVSSDVATALLAGMIAKTKSFQTSTVTPKSLTIASELVAAGARREEIIKNLFQTKSLSVLKLWGRALARLRATEDGKLVWAVLNRADFDRAGATPASLPGVLDELMVNTPDALITAVIFEDPKGGVTILVQTNRSVSGLKLFAAFQPEGTAHELSWHMTEGTIIDAEAQLRLGVETYSNK